MWETAAGVLVKGIGEVRGTVARPKSVTARLWKRACRNKLRGRKKCMASRQVKRSLPLFSLHA